MRLRVYLQADEGKDCESLTNHGSQMVFHIQDNGARSILEIVSALQAQMAFHDL